MPQTPILFCLPSDVVEGVGAPSTVRARLSNKEGRALALTKSFLATNPTPTEIEQKIEDTVLVAIERATKEAISALLTRNNLSELNYRTVDEVPTEIRQYVADMAAYFLVQNDRSQGQGVLETYYMGFKMARDFFRNHVITSVNPDTIEEVQKGRYNTSKYFLKSDNNKRQSSEEYL